MYQLVDTLYFSRSPKEKKSALLELSKNKEIYKIVQHRYETNLQINFTKSQIQSLLKNKQNGFDSKTVSNVYNKILMIKLPKERKDFLIHESKNLKKQEIIFLFNLIIKNLGVGYKVISEIFSLPYYPFQLAKKFSPDKIKQKKIYIIQPKLDGIRIQWNPKKGEFYTRNQEVLTSKMRPNLKIIDEQLNKIIKDYPELKDYIFDGEIFYKDWNNTISYVSTHEKQEGFEKLNFYIFDFIKIKEFKPNDKIIDKRLLNERLSFLRKFPYVEKINLFKLNKNIFGLPITSITGEVLKKGYFDILTYYVKQGFEGIMIKDIESEYINGRTDYWLKLKPQYELEVRIIGFEEGQGKYKNALGAFIVEAKIDGQTVTFNVGSGFSEKERNSFWEKRYELIGKIIDIHYQEISKDKIPRFPIFIRLRKDKIDINEEIL